MTIKNQKDLYTFYNNYIKPIYCEIEARENEIPTELLFEIHSAFDHIKRIYIDNQKEEEACQKAASHLKRGVLDAYKLKLKYFNTEIKNLNKIDISLIDNGLFLRNYSKEKLKIIEVAKKARLDESNENIEQAFEQWFEVSLLIDGFEKDFIKTD
ncbi:MAG TPA: hypothetical protein DHW82_05005 [Spirochaetia bacterium]|nr:hypothetical protein [Spirochaetia bacterium]